MEAPSCPNVNTTVINGNTVQVTVLASSSSPFLLYQLSYSQDPLFPDPAVTITTPLQASPLFLLTGLVPGKIVYLQAFSLYEQGAPLCVGGNSTVTPDQVPGPATVAVPVPVTGNVLSPRVVDPVVNKGSPLTGYYRLRYRYTFPNGTEFEGVLEQFGRDFVVGNLPRQTVVHLSAAAANSAGFGPFGPEVNASCVPFGSLCMCLLIYKYCSFRGFSF